MSEKLPNFLVVGGMKCGTTSLYHYLGEYPEVFICPVKENLPFTESLDREEERIAARYRMIWHYKSAGLYFSQVKAYLDSFDEVRVLLFEEFIHNPTGHVRDLYGFLEINDSFQPNTSMTYNISGIPRNTAIHRFLVKPNIIKKILKKGLGKLFSHLQFKKLRELAMQKNTKSIDEAKFGIDTETRMRLKEHFSEDIQKLQSLINRDLTEWLE